VKNKPGNTTLMRRLRHEINEHREASVRLSWKGVDAMPEPEQLEAWHAETRAKMHRTLRILEKRLHHYDHGAAQRDIKRVRGEQS